MNIIQRLKKEILDIQDRISQIQDECNHPSSALIVVDSSDVGNYDPSQDLYQTDYTCELCEKKWTKVYEN